MPWDGLFVTLAVIDLLSVIGLALVGLAMLRSGKAAAQKVQPAIAHARRTTEVGKRLTNHARRTGQEAYQEVRHLADRVQQRVETTRHLIRELEPAAPVDARAMVRSAQSTVSRGKEWADRLGRLRRAARTASRAAPPQPGPK